MANTVDVHQNLSALLFLGKWEIPLMLIAIESLLLGLASITWMRQAFHNSVPIESNRDRSEDDGFALSGVLSICSSMALRESPRSALEASMGDLICHWRVAVTNAAAWSAKTLAAEDTITAGL
jgi:hypothetical protein